MVKKDGEVHARLLTVRETARLMGAPDSFRLPGSANDGYKAMGDAVALPVARFIGERFLLKIAEAAYDDRRASNAELGRGVVYEHSLFDETNRSAAIAKIVDRYNDIIAAAETDPSLRIEFER